jgi:hypothetical protein
LNIEARKARSLADGSPARRSSRLFVNPRATVASVASG